uniref:PHD finger protein ALFIN-LIKE n=2 Tax=Cucumis melo TaxID=3656 RepID=A0A9I9E7I5_CUCME
MLLPSHLFASFNLPNVNSTPRHQVEPNVCGETERLQPKVKPQCRIPLVLRFVVGEARYTPLKLLWICFGEYMLSRELEAKQRRRLFNIINDMSTVFEAVTNIAKKQVKQKSSTANGSKSKSSLNWYSEAEMQGTCARKSQTREEVETYEEDEDEQGDILCRACGENYASDEF